MEKRTETDLLRFYGGDIKVRTEKNGFQMLYNKERPNATEDDWFWGDKDAYRTLNALLFDGYANEKERIFEEHKCLNPMYIKRIEDTIDIYKGIFWAMCQKKGESLSIPVVKRVDRKNSLNAYKMGHTGSFVSCTKKDYDEEFSNKHNVILLEIAVSENTPYADYQQFVTIQEYSNYDELEVLFPPFVSLEIEERDLTIADKHIKDMNGNSPVGKYLLKMGEFPDYRKTIAVPKEKLLNEILSGKEGAAGCLEKMNSGNWNTDYQKYVEWKDALHNYLKLVYSDMWYGVE